MQTDLNKFPKAILSCGINGDNFHVEKQMCLLEFSLLDQLLRSLSNGEKRISRLSKTAVLFSYPV